MYFFDAAWGLDLRRVSEPWNSGVVCTMGAWWD